jgi:ABC-type transport system involved in cytochrome c biogenesis permease subunit
MIDYSRYFPWAVVTLAAVYLLLCLVPPGAGPDQMDLYEFGTLPVQDGGRVKPIDSVARTKLLLLSNRQSWRDKAGNDRPAIAWLLDVMSENVRKDGAAQAHAVFRIDNDQLLELLKLKEKPGSFRYSIEEMQPRFREFDDKAGRAVNKEPAERDLLDRKALELRRHLEAYLELAQWQEPRMVPPGPGDEHWEPLALAIQPYVEALRQKRPAQFDNPAAERLLNMLFAYGKKDAKTFNAELDAYKKQVEKDHPEATSKASFEAAFNHFEPFYQCSLLYMGVFLMTCVGWLVWREPLRLAAFKLACLTLVVHTGALLARMYIGGRPPVTNLYSSAVFIGWACVILGLILERVYGLGLGNFVASVTGFTTVLIAHFLGTSGDTLDVLQAVLDTNFWLATHVTCITLGYAATYVAGVVGMVYIALGVGTRLLDKGLAKTLGQAVYGVTCFAMFLSFTGTVLGGIWADQSWGRFWGWDPKENGALLIVLINAILLHARWGGMVQARGMAVIAVFGNIVTTWSWFGVNMLGVGLHSYGFMEGAVIAMLGAIGTFTAFIVAGCLPLKFWRSFNAAPAPQPHRKPRLKPA